MIIAVDVDGVVADLLPVWLDRYNTDYADILTVYDITKWGLHEFVKEECGEKIYDYLIMRDLYDDVKPIDGALTCINFLKEKSNIRIIYVTSTPIESSGVKFRWLVKHGFLQEHEIKNYVEATDKSLIYAELLLDDGYHNIRTFLGKAVLYLHPYNEAEVCQYKVKNWVDFYHKFEMGVFHKP